MESGALIGHRCIVTPGQTCPVVFAEGNKRVALSEIDTQTRDRPAGNNAGSRVFSCIGDLLAHHARVAPGHHALLAPGRVPLTYAALWLQANDLVYELRSFGVGRNDRVAVVLPDGLEAAVATIAVAAGAVCVPLHPGFAADEWHRYFAALRIAALLTCKQIDSASRGVAYNLGLPVIDLSRVSDASSVARSKSRRSLDGQCASGTDDAFILLTSGTTSRPKMVPLTHANVCRSAYNVGSAIELGPQDRLLSVLPLFHGHGLISGVLAALAAGSSVVCTPGFDAAAFFEWMTEFRPTWYTAVPPIHRALLSAAPRYKRSARRSSLRLIRSASSSLPTEVLRKLEALFGVPVIETYGMTEAATQIAANPLDRRKPGSVGKPAGAEIAIMDPDGRQLPAGGRGEIVLRGPTITKGYDNDAAATASAFRDGWFRTGDLGYLDSEGYLFIVGRIKQADIINRGGQKVSPSEVEQALLSHPNVAEAVAFPVPHPRLGEDVAAAVVLRPQTKVTTQKLREFTSQRLATFKVPALIRIVQEIPKGPDGRIKRGALATAFAIASSRDRGERGVKLVAPRSQLEWQLAKAWAELLELNEIGIDQNVLSLGADSLMVTQMLSRLRARFGVDFSFKDIFDAPTIAALATRLESSERAIALVPLGVDESSTVHRSVPLSFQQQRIHILSRLDPTGYKYHVLDAVRLCGSLDADVLEASIATICERHEALRSTFSEVQGEPVQTVETVRPCLEHIDLRPCAESRRAAAIRCQMLELLRQPFAMEKEPPLRAQLLRLGEDDHALVIKLHHLITDGWSQRLFWEELEALYAARGEGAPIGLPELPIQYRHFVEWQRAWLRTPAAEEQLNYWRAQLEHVTELPLPTDWPRPQKWSGRGARYPLKLSRTLSRRLKSLSESHNVTLFMTLLAAFQCVLYRYTKRDDIAVGSLIANRNQIQTERLIGMFANAIVLRSDLSGDPTFTQLLARVRQITLAAYRNQDLPIEEILQALQVPRDLDRNPFFQVMFLLQNASSRAPVLAGLSAQFVDADPGVARSDLLLELIDAEDRLCGWLEYSTDLFEAPTIARMAAHLRTLLEAIVANPDGRISRLPLLPARERKRLLVDWNDTDTRLPHIRTFSERFARQVARIPDTIAVSTGQAQLSYSELERRSSAIANAVVQAGVGPDEVVVLLAERGVEFLAALIALQRSAGAFLPLDPTLPVARLAHIIQHSGARLVLTATGCVAALEEALSGIPRGARPQVLSLDDLVQARRRAAAPAVRPSPSSLACVIYTSGSTGLPKGAMIEERGLFNHLLSKISDLELSASDVLAQTSPQSFVISVWQFLTPLMVGARVHLCRDEEVQDPALLMETISRERITILQIVPSLLRVILQRAPYEPAFRALSGLRSLICTGESLAPEVCRDWFRQFPGVPLINAYGSTECSDDVATHRLTATPTERAATPIGRPIANARLYVLDSHLQPVPIGVAGELYVGGIAVGRGYLNDLEQTRRRFLPDPFSKRRGARLYWTGDLARWRPDGTLECLGRVDRQVKIRGCRIELEEIEHVLAEHSGVQSAVVLARDDTGSGEATLVAHIVAAADRRPKADELRGFLKTRLPAYMIPASYSFLDRLPLTPHGKVDRAAVATIRWRASVAQHELVAPRSSAEEVLARIWAELLEVEEIGITSNFFDLGGHSLLAGRVLARVANIFGVSLPIATLFEAPTIEALARRLDEARAIQSKEPRLEIARAKPQDTPSVSIVQENVFGIEREFPGLPQFNLPYAYRLQGPLDIPALECSIAEVVRRHDSLRTSFHWVDEQPIALIVPAAEIASPLSIEDLAANAHPGNGRAKTLLLKEAELQAEREAWKPFDLARAPLFRVRLFRLESEDHVLLLVLHHIVVDGWSIGLFFEELSKLYLGFAAGREEKVPKPPFQFSDLARWQRWWCTTDSATRQLAYWKDQLRDASPVFQSDGNRAGVLSGIAHEPIHLPHDLVARLSELGRSQGGTLFMTLLAGFKAMLLAGTGRGDICVGTAMANRSQEWTEGIIGPLENTTLIRTRIDLDLSFREALARVRESVLAAHARQELPFEILAVKLAEEHGVDPASLTQVFFVLQNAISRPLSLPDVEVRPLGDASQEGQPVLPIDRTWLRLTLKERPSGVAGSCAYKEDLFDAKLIRHGVADYKRILAKAAENPEMSLGRLAEH
jgi:amino acid adenylation domain-containing protein